MICTLLKTSGEEGYGSAESWEHGINEEEEDAALYLIEALQSKDD